MSKGTVLERVSVVETKVDNIEEDLQTILRKQDESSTYITSEFAKMNARLDKVASVWGVVALIISAVVAAIVSAVKYISGKA